MGPLLLAVLCAAPDAGPPVAEFIRGGKVVRASRLIANTKVSLAVADPPAQGMSEHDNDLDEAFGVFNAFTRDADRSREGAMVATLEAGAGGDAVELQPGACELLTAAQSVAKRSQGTFDFVQLKADAGLTAAGPAELELAKCKAKLKHAGAQLELGEVPLAVAIDAVVKLWRAKGYRDFSVTAGPLGYWSGAVGDQSWHIELSGGGRKLGQLELRDTAVATRGDDASGTVRVEAKKAIDALGLALAVQKSPAAAGLAVLAAAGARGVFVDAAGAVKFSPALKLLK